MASVQDRAIPSPTEHFVAELQDCRAWLADSCLQQLSGTVCLVKHSRTELRPWGQREGVPRLLLAKLLPLAFLAGLAALPRAPANGMTCIMTFYPTPTTILPLILPLLELPPLVLALRLLLCCAATATAAAPAMTTASASDTGTATVTAAAATVTAT